MKLKNLKGVLAYLKEKYNQVRIYKTVKKSIFIYQVFEVISKNNRKLYYFAMFDKKNNLYVVDDKEAFKKIAKSSIDKRIKESLKYVDVVKNSQRAGNVKKNEMGFKSITKQKAEKLLRPKKIDVAKRFRNDKEFADWTWIWTIIRFGLLHLDSEEKYFEVIVENKRPTIKIKKDVKISKEEMLIYKIYSRLVNITKDEELLKGTTKYELLETRFEKLYKHSAREISQKTKGKSFYYSDVYHLLYMIMLWQNNVKNKKIDTIMLFSKEYLQSVYEMLNKFEELADDEKEQNVTWDIIDNSCVFADLWFNENYKDFKEIGKLKIGEVKCQ
jgi:hypothetical protein